MKGGLHLYTIPTKQQTHTHTHTFLICAIPCVGIRVAALTPSPSKLHPRQEFTNTTKHGSPAGHIDKETVLRACIPHPRLSQS